MPRKPFLTVHTYLMASWGSMQKTVDPRRQIKFWRFGDLHARKFKGLLLVSKNLIFSIIKNPNIFMKIESMWVSKQFYAHDIYISFQLLTLIVPFNNWILLSNKQTNLHILHIENWFGLCTHTSWDMSSQYSENCP